MRARPAQASEALSRLPAETSPASQPILIPATEYKYKVILAPLRCHDQNHAPSGRFKGNTAEAH